MQILPFMQQNQRDRLSAPSSQADRQNVGNHVKPLSLSHYFAHKMKYLVIKQCFAFYLFWA